MHEGTAGERAARPLEIYVPRMLVSWLERTPDERVRSVEGSLAFVDISGFTRLTERLARRGVVGAEELSDILDDTFGTLLGVARADGAELVKWGGDAVLLFYDDEDHAARAARSASRMRRTLREISQRRTSAGAIALRMSVGIHSAVHHFFLVGDPEVHRELIVSGPAASVTAEMEATAAAGQIVVSQQTAACLPPHLVGAVAGEGRLLRGEPQLDDLPVRPRRASRVDIGSLLPPMIRDYVRAESGDSEHRPIAVAFVQFSGTDAVLADGGPPALAAALDECVRTVQHAAAANGVTFFESDINRDGGKIMMTAGAPRSAGSDEERMLRAVRQIVDGAGTLPLRVGVNRGYVFAGEFGPEFRRTYSVKGDAINLAARVMGKAAPGEILATREVMDRSRTRFEVDVLPPFMVKGKAKPVDAVRVGPMLGALAVGADDAPFVGRVEALTAAAGAAQAAREGRGSLLDITGAPGIGKSRFAIEVLMRAPDLAVVTGRGDAYESNTAYLPFRALLLDALQRRYGVDADASWLLRAFAADAPQLAPWAPLLGVVLDIEIADTTETAELDEQFRRTRLTEVVLDALTVLLPAPSFLVFEDAHLFDDASADVLHHIETHLAERPWIVLVTRRVQATGYVPAADSLGYVALALGALDPEAAVQLVAAVTRGTPLTRPAMRALADRAGGNPLFLGSLAVIAERSTSLSDLPESVEGVITSEIDRMDPFDRSLLRYAAVLGMHFAEADLRDLLSGRAAAMTGTVAERLAEFLDDDGTTLHFRHALVRDVAYAGLPFRLRREMHGRVGDTIEARLEDPDTESELLSLHFFHAGSYVKAWSYSRAAGERAYARYAYAEAAEFFERALDAAKRLGGEEPRQLAAVSERLGDARSLAGASRAAIAAFRAARRELATSSDAADVLHTADLMYKEAILSQRLGRFTPSLALLTHGLRRLNVMDGPHAAAVRAKLSTRYGFARYLQGRGREAIRWCRVGVTEAERGNDKSALAMAYNALELAYLHSAAEPDRRYGELAMQTYEEIGDLPGQGHCANTLAIAAHGDGRWAEAEQLFARAADVFGRIGDIANECNAIYNRADLLLRQGHFAAAEHLLREVMETALAVADEELVGLALRELARACGGLGRYDEAEHLLDESQARFTALGLRHELVSLLAARAENAVRSGAPALALEVADEATALARETGIADVIAWLHRIRAEASIELGAMDAAGEHLVRAGAAAAGYERALLLLIEARLADARGDDGRALRSEARELLAGLGALPLVDTALVAG